MPEDDYNPDNYFYFDLVGKQITYDVTLDNVGCSCNAALYSVQMPAMDYNGNPVAGPSGDYYCDANDVGGKWCPEMDFFEANKYAMQTTPHKCDGINGHEYENCDRSGCSTNAWYVDSNMYGPNSYNTIDTTRTFTQQMNFWGCSGNLEWLQTTLYQDSN